jgi:hypothetical protein
VFAASQVDTQDCQYKEGNREAVVVIILHDGAKLLKIIIKTREKSVYLGFDEVNWARMRKFATQTIFTVLRDEQ